MIPRLLLILSLAATLSAQAPDLVARIDAGPFDEHDRTDVVVEVETVVPLVDAEEIVLEFLGSLEVESFHTGLGMTCEKRSDNWLLCNVAQLAAGGKANVAIRAKPLFFTRGNRFVLVNLGWRERGLRSEWRSWRKDLFQFAHEYVVTHTGDSGEGSLRQGIEDAKSYCTTYTAPCLIRFDLGPAATIKPLTPLPEIRAVALTIDGEDKVTLDGSLVGGPANGLLLAGLPTSVTIRRLAISSFPENGIEVAAGQETRVESCVITGNRSRGVTMTAGGSLSVSDSVLSGNGRSGLFLNSGAASVVRSLIGVAADGATPMPNGASGVFAGSAYRVVLQDNVIAHNGHFGVALPRNNPDVDVGRNRIVGNRLGQIDVDLDGPSFFVRPPVQFAYAPPNGPALFSATYDPSTGTTTVTGRLDNVDFFYFLTYDLQFFATTAANEADQFLGAIHITRPEFTVAFPGDLRGRFVTANTIRWVHDEITDRGTSELSAPMEVR